MSAGEAEGIGSCMLGWFDEKKVRKILGIPSIQKSGTDNLHLGYSLSEHREKKRKPTGGNSFV